MGRITSKRKPGAINYQALTVFFSVWSKQKRPVLLNFTFSAIKAIGRAFKKGLLYLWNLPEKLDWLSPLPTPHRRAIITAFIIVLIALLWPYTPETHNTSSLTRNHALQNTNRLNELLTKIRNNDKRLFKIQQGQTLAQLFRDNNLPVGDVFAMAQVEGRQKPLSNLKVGQQVSITVNPQGNVSSLEIETTTNKKVCFLRQEDGSFEIKP